MSELSAAEIVDHILSNIALPPESSKREADTARREYNENFASEGGRKVKFVLDDLKELERQEGFNPQTAVAISIGGSDGSDLHALMDEIPIMAGVLLEYDNDAARIAMGREQREDGRVAHVVIGDAKQQLDAALTKISLEGAETLIVICCGVLHELPERSPNYTHDWFFDTLLKHKHFHSKLIYCAEPCGTSGFPQSWPHQVELKIDDTDAEKLKSLAYQLGNRHFPQNIVRELETRGEHRLIVDGNLAIEILHKVIRYNDMPRFHHEMGERLTSFKPWEIERSQGNQYGDELDIEVHYATSRGFRDAYRKYNIEAWDENARKLSIPKSHCKLIIRRIKWKDQHQATKNAPLSGEQALEKLRKVLVRKLGRAAKIRNLLTAELYPAGANVSIIEMTEKLLSIEIADINDTIDNLIDVVNDGEDEAIDEEAKQTLSFLYEVFSIALPAIYIGTEDATKIAQTRSPVIVEAVDNSTIAILTAAIDGNSVEWHIPKTNISYPKGLLELSTPGSPFIDKEHKILTLNMTTALHKKFNPGDQQFEDVKKHIVDHFCSSIDGDIKPTSIDRDLARLRKIGKTYYYVFPNPGDDKLLKSQINTTVEIVKSITPHIKFIILGPDPDASRENQERDRLDPILRLLRLSKEPIS